MKRHTYNFIEAFPYTEAFIVWLGLEHDIDSTLEDGLRHTGIEHLESPTGKSTYTRYLYHLMSPGNVLIEVSIELFHHFKIDECDNRFLSNLS